MSLKRQADQIHLALLHSREKKKTKLWFTKTIDEESAHYCKEKDEESDRERAQEQKMRGSSGEKEEKGEGTGKKEVPQKGERMAINMPSDQTQPCMQD